jgi:ribosomal protein S17E
MEDGYYKREFQIEKNVWENFYNSFTEKNEDNKSFLAEIRIK